MRRVLVGAVMLTGAFALATAHSAQSGRPVKTVNGGMLDKIELFADKAPTANAVVIRLFSAISLAEQFVAKLRESGPFKVVSILEGAELPENALVVNGTFTEADPCSRAKQYFVGFGSGNPGQRLSDG